MGEKIILAVSAHPDDVEFTAGGSLTRWISEGWKVYLVVCTDGGKGTHDPTVKPAELAVLRRGEQLAAAAVLGVSEVFFLENPDGELNQWFDENVRTFQAEINALRQVVPKSGTGIEIGIGSGRLAAASGIKLGVEPSRRIAEIAAQRGIAVCQALRERLPFVKEQFDFVLLVTVICFVPDMLVLLREIHRVLAPGGLLINGFIDKDSALGREYESRKDQDKFYRSARFYSTGQVAEITRQAGFGDLRYKQTVFGMPGIAPDFDRIQDGSGEGAFVALSARKLSNG